MKKWFIGICSILLLSTLSFGATKGNRVQKKISKNFTPGSVVSGTPSTGKVRRWYFFNEGAIGASYTFLGRAQYTSIDLGYNFYLRSIESMLGGVNFFIGSEINMPLYFKTMPGSRSNIISGHPRLESKETQGLSGVGIQIPLVLGFEYQGFYVAGLAGYTWLFMNDTYPSKGAGVHPTIQTQYDGVIYGGGIGYKISNIINIGVRYIAGSLTDRSSTTKPSGRAIAEGLDKELISAKTQRDIFGIPYQSIHVFISLIY
ncbi:hypothetical protein [Helicobacter mustelae]|uniref:Putative outer membrane protein n=1 Tax=Helicobacter mustelae (strain ATCC 43772 / CCUG 25715 / CIP 103759 / LMG 18044 / NCTC 12198 / R85-136P) TaxID=679897 RepID=D3UJC7_HELM1|nr:hypothetical protein [Helicobacter mustelae]CBG40602.1 Putative outer membrane protein [Helicobacter mustelae 12198]SQH72099.1 outer membrane protein [Helicobacter mustelae]STP13243.1 outer membrane protein [Helicobacter mustelae]